MSECTLDVSRPGSLNYSMVWREVVILSVRLRSVQFIDDLEMLLTPIRVSYYTLTVEHQCATKVCGFLARTLP